MKNINSEANRIDVRDESGKASKVVVRRVAALALVAAGAVAGIHAANDGPSENKHADKLGAASRLVSDTPSAETAAKHVKVENAALVIKSGEKAEAKLYSDPQIVENDLAGDSSDAVLSVPKGQAVILVRPQAIDVNGKEWVTAISQATEQQVYFPEAYYNHLSASTGETYSTQYNDPNSKSPTQDAAEAGPDFKTTDGDPALLAVGPIAADQVSQALDTYHFASK